MLLESTANCSSADSPEKSALLSFDLRSTLLDSILHIILSFLPAWHSVQMSALLWRWRDLWCSVPFINIDERSFDVRGYDETKSMCPSGCCWVHAIVPSKRQSLLKRTQSLICAIEWPSCADGWLFGVASTTLKFRTEIF